jgi:hypothetical protein
MKSKTKARLLSGALISLYVGAHIAADKDVPRNTKPITILAQATANSSSSMIAHSTTTPSVMTKVAAIQFELDEFQRRRLLVREIG